MARPLVSIVIPAHNAAPWIRSTLDSARGQSWQPCEIIVVDDGSTDDTLSIAREYESRTVAVVAQGNEGPGSARNAGLARAQGDFIQFLDADDLLSPDKISAQIGLLAGAPENVLASCQSAKFRVDPRQALDDSPQLWRDFSAAAYLLESSRLNRLLPIHAWLVPRALVDRAGPFQPRLRTNEDVEFFNRVVAHSAGIRFCAAGRAYYRAFHTRSLSRSMSNELAQGLVDAADLIEATLAAATGIPAADAARISANHHQRVAYALYPTHAALSRRAEEKARRLGGFDLELPMGRSARMLASIVGWRPVQRVRSWLWRRGVYPGQRHVVAD